jgi:hypothetical protein
LDRAKAEDPFFTLKGLGKTTATKAEDIAEYTWPVGPKRLTLAL